jgi:hypothetical protein
MSPLRCLVIILSCAVGIHALQLPPVLNKPRALQGFVVSRGGGGVARRATPHTGFCSDAGVAGPMRANGVYLKQDSGMRISRIVTASTSSYDAMVKLGRATSRAEIMKICLLRHKRTSLLFEQQELPAQQHRVQGGWAFEQMPDSSISACSGLPGSVLWATDAASSYTKQIEVGSWLLSMVYAHDCNHYTALFSPSTSRVFEHAQPITLVRPGVTTPPIVDTAYGPMWTIMFIELQCCDELGFPKRGCHTKHRHGEATSQPGSV